MIELKDFTSFIEKKFPVSYAEDFDNVGLLIGRSEKKLNKILICLDCTDAVVEEAITFGAELILTHHPVIFSPVKSINDLSSFGKFALKAIENNISIYSAHTNVDSSPGGLADCIANMLDLVPYGTITEKIGRICNVRSNITAAELCNKIKKKFNTDNLFSTIHSDKPVHTVALCNGGGGGSTAEAVLKLEPDIYISGDLKHHEVLEMYQHPKTDYIEICHHTCEFPFTELLKSVIDKQFAGSIEAIISNANTAPMINTSFEE